MHKKRDVKMKKTSTSKLIKASVLGLFMLAAIMLTVQYFNPSEEQVNKENVNKSGPVRAVSTAKIGSMGDLLIHSPILSAFCGEKSKTYNFEKIFTHLKPYIKTLDYAVINMEGTLAESNFSGYPMFRCPDNIIDCAKDCGFDMFLTANNHSNDGGVPGFTRTAEVLKSKNVDFIGTRLRPDDKKYIIKDINGVKLGMVNYTYGEISDAGIISVNGIPSSAQNSKLFNVFDYNQLDDFYKEQSAIIVEMRANGADKIIYYMHWGAEYQLKENTTQRAIAQKLCDLGVDVIIGGHPHVIQPIDVLHSDISGKTTLCIYSIGNAVSNQRQERMDMKSGHTEDGVLFSVTFTKYSDGNVLTSDVEILPTWVNLYSSNGKNIYQIVPLNKSINWQSNFNLSASQNGVERANKSFNRTLQLLSPGLQKAKDALSQRLAAG